MRTVRSSSYAFPAEVARYLACEPEDVKRMIRHDRLPVTRIPKRTRNVIRIYLPDLHAWLLGRSGGAMERLADYRAFLTEFERSARTAAPEAEDSDTPSS